MAQSEKTLATNRQARHNYEVDESLECGIVLTGTEVKSMKAGKFSFSDSYGRIKKGELWLVAFHISPYKQGNIFNHETVYDRKLLIKKMELKHIKRKVEEKGFTLVPLRFYLKQGLIKLELGICKGKKLHDKRATIKNRDLNREAQREIKQHFN